MSQENVELAKEGTAAINETYATGDILAWRRYVEKAFDPEVVLEAGGKAAFTEGQWLGHEGAIGFVANQMDVLEGMWLRADEYIDVDDDCLVVMLTFGGRARHTGLDVQLSPGHVFRLHNGRVLQWQIFGERNAALEAAGLSE